MVGEETKVKAKLTYPQFLFYLQEMDFWRGHFSLYANCLLCRSFETLSALHCNALTNDGF